MKRIFLLLVFVSVLFPAFSLRVQIGQLYYNLDDESVTAEVTYDEKYDDNKYYVKGSISIPETITYYGINYHVTSIGEQAFRACSELTSVTIPNSITSIRSMAFFQCSGLTKVNISDLEAWCNIDFGDYTANPLYYAQNLYLNGKHVTDLPIPKTVKAIKWGAFWGCSSLTSVGIPNSVTSIENYAFRDCSGLASVQIGNSVTSIGSEAFRGCSSLASVIIPNSVNSIGDRAFLYCRGLTSVIIGNSVTSIEEYTFSGCTRLTSVTIPNSVTAIGKGSFDDCPIETLSIDCSRINNFFKSFKTIKKLILGKSVTTIVNDAFSGCDLTEIVLETDTAPTYYDAFSNFYNKATLVIPDTADIRSYLLSVYYWPNFQSIVQANGDKLYLGKEGDFEYRFIESLGQAYLHKFYDSNATTYVSIPDKVVGDRKGVETYYPVTGIGQYAFYDNKNLSLVIIPESCEVIGRGAFFGCSSLVSVDIPNTVTVFEIAAFRECTALTSFKIPNSVTKIDNAGFYECTSLASIEIPNSVTLIGPYVFGDCTELKSVTIGNSVTSIGGNVFLNCEFDNFTLADGVEEMVCTDENNIVTKNLYLGRPINGPISFSGLGSLEVSGFVESLPVDRFNHNPDLTSLIINPGGGVVIEDAAFFGCTGLAEITLPEDIAQIGANAFRGTALKNITIPNGTIGANAFANCNLDNIIIGAGVESIGEKAFDGSNALNAVYATPTTPPAAQNNTFSYYEAQLYVPEEAINAYSNSPCWTLFNGNPIVMPQSISVQGPTTIKGEAGETFQLSATVSPANVTLDRILWRSTNPAVATVDNNGLVTIHNFVPSERMLARAGYENGVCEIIASTLYEDSPVAVVKIQVLDTSVDYINSDDSGSDWQNGIASNDIYTLTGVCLKRDASQSDLDALAPGIYIYRGKKVVVR